MNPIVFTRPDLILKLSNPKVREILDGIPEFAELRQRAANIRRGVEYPPAADEGRFAERLATGEDPTDLSHEFAALRAARTDFDQAHQSMRRKAESEHDQAVGDALHAQASAIRGAYLAAYIRIVGEARTLDVGHVTGWEDIKQSPASAEAFARFEELATDLANWRASYANFFDINLDPRAQRWPEAQIIKHLDVAWPAYVNAARAEGSPGHEAIYIDGDASSLGTPNDLLRLLAENDVELWAPTEAEVFAERSRLTDAAISHQRITRNEAYTAPRAQVIRS